jgi:hypothetical protein
MSKKTIEAITPNPMTERQSVPEDVTALSQPTDEQELTIDPEFRDMFPAKTDEEYKELEIMLLRDGCRDPVQSRIFSRFGTYC